MTAKEVRQKFFDFFQKQGHKIIAPASLVPVNDSTTLFTSSGMQPLIPYLLGQVHPEGKRLVDSQPCFRGQGINSDDTLEVGNVRHTTFFEMLGNWSLGDYFKEDQLRFFFTFLTDTDLGLGLDPKKIYVSVFEGNDLVPRDNESIKIWKKLFAEKGIEAKEGERIVAYGVDKNWWSRSGVPDQMPIGEIGGPDSEVYYDFGTPHDLRFGEKCHPACDCGRFLEIGNSVFIQYQKQKDGTFAPLSQKNVDFGGGLERLTAAAINNQDIFCIDLFVQIINEIEKATKKNYSDDQNKPLMRIVADHIKAAVFLIKAGVMPSNKDRGYILRRLLRRAAVKIHNLNNEVNLQISFVEIAGSVVETYDGLYFEKTKDLLLVKSVIGEEINKFSRTLDKGLREIQKIDKIDGKIAFDLYQTFGFPVEITTELATQKGQQLDLDEFRREFDKHKEASRSASAGMFKGGLADHSEVVTKYHTATHLLHQALRQVLGDQVHQIGSNITSERARFDFTYPEKLTEEQIRQVEKIINEKIKENLPVTMQIMTLEQAKKEGALAFFAEKYGQQVKVFSVGTFSKEVCGGPHVKYTGELNDAKIIKEEAVGAGKRRIYLTLG